MTMLELNGVVGKTKLGPVGSNHPLDFGVGAGEVGVILGGKETSALFRLILGLGELDAGEIKIDGRVALGRDTSEMDAMALRKAVGFGFRDKGLLSNLSLRDNVDLPAKYHGYYKQGVPKSFFGEQALRELGVDRQLWDLRPSRINGEIRKCVLLARAIVLTPKVLILDDPSALVASLFLPTLLRFIRRQKDRGTAVLIGTNDLPVGLAAADWVLHPERRVPVKQYEDFVDGTWIRSAALLAERMRQP
jgi:ABC-type transporter Mla maintaining outer membrane lipid asymmetry ATPase subunit MlaF